MKYVFIFLTFLSVCTTVELLQIPLTLDAKKTINLPDSPWVLNKYIDTIIIKPSDDPDFQRYLDKIRSYTIDSVSFTTSNLTGEYARHTTIPRFAIITIKNLDTGETASTGEIDLGSTKAYNLGISGAGLSNMANKIQNNGSLKLELIIIDWSLYRGGFDLNLKFHTKIKV